MGRPSTTKQHDTLGVRKEMCGICGALRFDELAVSPTTIAKMSAVMHHRGPDGEGIHIADGVGLGHRRLSVIDLARGSQPMTDPSGKVANRVSRSVTASGTLEPGGATVTMSARA